MVKLVKYLKFFLNNILLVVVMQPLTTHAAFAQNNPIKLLDHETSISGTFGEFRGSHLHAGIDFKTGKREGIPVYAAADGYVFRVLVSRTGYGKAIYLHHDNDLTTVYAHLRAFAPSIEGVIYPLQKKQRNFEIDHYPVRSAIKVKKGQIIGYSGNSGSSEGPHLHFETRNTRLETPFDPSLVGVTYPDTIPPKVRRVFLYDLPEPLALFPLPKPRGMNISEGDTLPIGPFTILGLETYDLAGAESNRLGIRSVKVFLDSQPFLYYENGPFTFGQSSHITAMMDQRLRSEGIESFLCFRAVGNKLPFYKMGYEGGIINSKNGKLITCTIEVADMLMNKTTVTFSLDPSSAISPRPIKDSNENHVIRSGETKSYICGPFEVSFEENTIHGLSQVAIDSVSGQSDIFLLEPEGISFNKTAKVSFDISKIPKDQQQKTVIATSKDGKEWASVGGKISNLRIEASTNQTGLFTLRTDNIGPEFGEMAYFKDDYSGKMALLLKVKDDLSGIQTIQCKIDGHWVLSEYNSSHNELIIYNIDKHTNKKATITAIDKRTNQSTKHFKIKLD